MQLTVFVCCTEFNCANKDIRLLKKPTFKYCFQPAALPVAEQTSRLHNRRRVLQPYLTNSCVSLKGAWSHRASVSLNATTHTATSKVAIQHEANGQMRLAALTRAFRRSCQPTIAFQSSTLKTLRFSGPSNNMQEYYILPASNKKHTIKRLF